MFRRLSESLPKDPEFPPSLEKLGYFINEKDQIRMISHPAEGYRYKISSEDRVNDLFKEAHHTCLRAEVLDRLHSLGLQTLRLPLGASERTPHIPILVSPNLSTCTRIVVYFGERNEDLGIFSYRTTGGEEGINAGSAVDFVKAIQSRHSSSGSEAAAAPGIVLANPGQLIWCRSQGRAMGRTEWESLPRQTSVHPAFRLDDETGRNLVEGNRDEGEHVEYVFEQVLKSAGGAKARLDIIGSEWTGAAVIRYLGENWPTWSTRINGICLIAPLHSLEYLLPLSPTSSSTSSPSSSPLSPSFPSLYQSFGAFVSARCRAYVVHPELALGALVEAGRAEFGCNVYASGEPHYVECVMVRAWRDMLGWLARLEAGEEGAEEKWQMSVAE